MYSTRPGLTLGFHGCDKTLVDDILLNRKTLNHSTNPHDWLGHGVYFWENSLSRAIHFANELKNNPRPNTKSPITVPAAIGAILNLGHCLDLIDLENLQLLKKGHKLLKSLVGNAMPVNKAPVSGKDLLIRHLDCAVIEALHLFIKDEGLPAFDSIRGVFWEGKPVYPNAGFKDKNHIQICIINPNCIKGLFLPRENDINHKKI